MKATWLADVLRASGIPVVELAGWKQRGSELADVDALVWHHDGSPPGASPSVPQYMARQIDSGRPGAQCWVELDGTWHLSAAGKAFHTGEVRAGKAGNSRALGVETDHTTGETWPAAQLDSLRRGTAAILRYLGATEQALEFHKTICSPPGRKTDPDGLDLAIERAAVSRLLAAPKEDVLVRDERIIVVPSPRDGRQLVSKDKTGIPLGAFAATSSVQVCASNKGDLTSLLVQPTHYGDDLVIAVARLDGTAAPVGAEARIIIEHR